MDNNNGRKIIRKDNIIKRWWKLASPNKGYLAGQIITFSIYAIFLGIITIFAARTINCMYARDWKGAYTYLAIELLTIILRNVALHIEYHYYCRQVGHIRLNIGKKIYQKFLSCKSNDLTELSKEKVTNIALNNTDYIAEFPDTISAFVAKVLQVVFTLAVIFISNYIAGLIVLALGVVNFFAYYLFNKKLGRIMLERYEKKDDMFKSYSKIIDSKAVIRELKAKDQYENELTTNIGGFNKSFSRWYMLYSWKNNLYFAAWQVIVYAIAALMLYFVSQNTMDIAIYLIIVPYLSSGTDLLNQLFDKTSTLENMRVDVDRINIILNLSDEELIHYGNLNKESSGYNLGLLDVTENKKPGQKYTLKDVSMSFKTGGINVVKGPKENGKRVIFDILRRQCVPDKGKALLDNLNLFDYNDATFSTHINYCASHPAFIKGTIKENLTVVNKNMANVEDVCAKLKILNEIVSLEKGFDTSITEIKSEGTLFLLGLARALLTDSKILMIYEIPVGALESLRRHVVDLLSSYRIDKTIILFTHTDEYDEFADVIYSVVEGNVTKIK